jgi:hypothetical protein
MRSVWWSRRAITLHVALIVAVPLFLTLGSWQLHRALRGNMLSWAYVFEWPFFACYATWMWWRLVHEETATAGDLLPVAARRRNKDPSAGGEHEGSGMDDARARANGAGAGVAGDERRQLLPAGESVPVPRDDYDPFDDEADPELAAYNRYLAGLHQQSPKR